MTPLRVVQFGLGPIGLATAEAVLDKAGSGRLALVGAIDIDPDKVGLDVGTLINHAATGIVVESDATAALSRIRPDLVLHTTSSFLPGVVSQLELCARFGANVVSSTEELSYPYFRNPELTERLHTAALDGGITILGTGVNPGYAMDTLALAATAPCLKIDRIVVAREVDAGLRREPLQRKVGAGIPVEQFREQQETGTFGHIGLEESLRMLAAGLEWDLDAVEESLDPIVAVRRVKTRYLSIEKGRVAGIHQVAAGVKDGENRITLDLKMFVGADNPRDAVHISGDPPIDLVVKGGIFGDTATVAALLNAIPLVQRAPVGLVTMNDLPVPRAFGTNGLR